MIEMQFWKVAEKRVKVEALSFKIDQYSSLLEKKINNFPKIENSLTREEINNFPD